MIESSEGEADDDLEDEGGGVGDGDKGRVVDVNGDKFDVLIVRDGDDDERKKSKTK